MQDPPIHRPRRRRLVPMLPDRCTCGAPRYDRCPDKWATGQPLGTWPPNLGRTGAPLARA